MFRNDILKRLYHLIWAWWTMGLFCGTMILQWHTRKRKTAVPHLKYKLKCIVYLFKKRMMNCLTLFQKTCLCTKAIKGHAKQWSGQIISTATWVWNWLRWSSWWLLFFEIVYCVHPTLPYAHIQLKQATKFILSNSQEEEHPFIHDTLKNKNTQLFSLFFYRLHKNASRTDITNDDQKSYSFAPTYWDEFTAFQCHIISAVVFFYSNKLQIMLADYAVTEMGYFDDYSDYAPRAITMRGNVITEFILHVY